MAEYRAVVAGLEAAASLGLDRCFDTTRGGNTSLRPTFT
jgi:hypothetical protein